MPDQNKSERVPIFAFIGTAVFLWCMFVIFSPDYTPAFVQPIDAWMRAHPLAWPGIIIAIAIVDFSWAAVRTVGTIILAVEGIDKKVDSIANELTEVKEQLYQEKDKLDSVTTDLAEVLSDLRDLSREVSK